MRKTRITAMIIAAAMVLVMTSAAFANAMWEVTDEGTVLSGMTLVGQGTSDPEGYTYEAARQNGEVLVDEKTGRIITNWQGICVSPVLGQAGDRSTYDFLYVGKVNEGGPLCDDDPFLPSVSIPALIANVIKDPAGYGPGIMLAVGGQSGSGETFGFYAKVLKPEPKESTPIVPADSENASLTAEDMRAIVREELGERTVPTVSEKPTYSPTAKDEIVVPKPETEYVKVIVEDENHPVLRTVMLNAIFSGHGGQMEKEIQKAMTEKGDNDKEVNVNMYIFFEDGGASPIVATGESFRGKLTLHPNSVVMRDVQWKPQFTYSKKEVMDFLRERRLHKAAEEKVLDVEIVVVVPRPVPQGVGMNGAIDTYRERVTLLGINSCNIAGCVPTLKVRTVKGRKGSWLSGAVWNVSLKSVRDVFCYHKSHNEDVMDMKAWITELTDYVFPGDKTKEANEVL